ncbi:MAG: hypothetical protein CVU73_04950 [Deltaproteobacteria bacterium HGW-Deltaproteobacteria-8]|jgi:hypothetical protein|nr:MAG: hypothetical protein CVU73_04950 [Deltaproteobacteria bacterium HGW-Deltaproteobacteria-8]
MGRTLQIRVSASTFDPVEVERRWPRLSALAFSPVAVKIPALPPETRGVQELVVHLADRLEIGMLPDEAARELADGIRKAASSRARLEAELAEWNAKAANAATDEIEDALDELEAQAKKLKDQPGPD